MTKLSDGRVFQCPSCGDDTLQEMIIGVTQYININKLKLHVEEHGSFWAEALDRDEPQTTNGYTEGFVCANCDEEIPEADLEDCFKEITDETT